MPRAAFDAVLFDLDGTLADTAPDLGHALNRLRAAEGLAPVHLDTLRPLASAGTRGMLWGGFRVRPGDTAYAGLAHRFLALYAERLCVDTAVFPTMLPVLDAIEAAGLRWGVVTNKPAHFALPLLESLGLAARAACVVGGDTTARPKPAPDPLLYACNSLATTPACTPYVGDDKRDIDAGRAAGMPTIAAAWGYLGVDSPIDSWQADRIADTPPALLPLLGIDAAQS